MHHGVVKSVKFRFPTSCVFTSLDDYPVPSRLLIALVVASSRCQPVSEKAHRVWCLCLSASEFAVWQNVYLMIDVFIVSC